MADVGNGVSTGGDSSPISSPHTPPHKRRKSSIRRHRGHKYKARKGFIEGRKRRDRGSSSSALSRDSTESTSSDSDHETSKKHKELDKRWKQSHRHSQYPGNTHQCSTPQLTMADHHRVVQSLKNLKEDQLLAVGVVLGLHYPSLMKMKNLLYDLVAAWLMEDNNVTEASGSPSWASLATALEDIGHKGIASKIRTGPMQAMTAIHSSPGMSSAFSRYRNYLKSYYDVDPVACDDKLSIAPCSEFISLALVEKDKSANKDDTFSQCRGINQILSRKVPLELDAILTPESKFVLVEGPPGIGKSTLSWELCRKWDTCKSLQCYNIVLLLKLREGRVQNASSLNELFYHDDRVLCESVVSEVLRCEGEGVLLILDGYDELPTSVVQNKESLIMRVIRHRCIPKATRLVTSRPSALCSIPQNSRHVEIVGFTDEKIIKFAETAFKLEPNVLLEFKKFLFSNPIIKTLMHIPVNCAILAQSYKDIMRSSKQVPKTTTQLYTMLTRILIRRHLIAIGRWDEDSRVPSHLKDLPEDVYRDLERVSKLAYTGLFKKDIQLVFTDNDVGEGFHSLSLLNEVKEMYACEGAGTSYTFLHLSLQEFLAAWYVSNHQELVEQVLSETLCSNSPQLHVFGRILSGLIGISDLYAKYLLKWYHTAKRSNFLYSITLYACHCVYEAQNNTSNDVFSSFDYYNHVLLYSPIDSYVFGYCLAYIPLEWSFVILQSSIDMLVSSLSDHASGNIILGSIDTLQLSVRKGLSFSSKLKDLPQSLSIKKLEIFTDSSLALLDEVPLLPHLEEITIGDLEGKPESYGYLLKYISKCPNLKSLVVRCKLTKRNVYGLATAIAGSSTIEELELDVEPVHSDEYECRMDSLAQAALSCPSLKELVTHFPFVISRSTSPKNLLSIQLRADILIFKRYTKLPTFFDYLYNIANVCKVSPLQYVILNIGIDFEDFLPFEGFLFEGFLPSLPYDCVDVYYDCIALLNVCLHHHWPSMKRLELPFSNPCTQFHLSKLSRALRKDPDTSQLKLRRSKSLSDLVYLKTLDKLARKNVRFNYAFESYAPVKSQSFPDLVGIQSLHPLIAQELFPDCDSGSGSYSPQQLID